MLTFAALAFYGTLLAATSSLPLPVTTLAEVQQFTRAVLGPVGRCGPDIVLGWALEIQGTPYVLYIADARFVLASNLPGDDTPVWLGILRDSQFILQETMSFGELQVRYPGVCAFFHPGGSGG